MSWAPRFLLEGSATDPVIVLRSSFWSFNAIGFFDGGQACVVDPGIYPREIEALDQALRTRGCATRRTVTHVLLTHSHHDHIRGWMRFSGATVTLPAVAAAKTPEVQGRILATKRKIDELLHVSEAGFRYPRPDLVFEDRATLRVGELEVQLRFLPGHSNCTSVVWIPALATLCTADYLVSPGLPYCRWQARDFERATATMTRWVETEGVERVLPAHNDPIVGSEAILAALSLEREYFLALREDVRAALGRGLEREACVRSAARAAGERRGGRFAGRQRQDLDNARRVLAEEWSGARPG